MSTRITRIITEARVILNDTNRGRWTDRRLVALISTGQREICRKLPLLTKTATINVFSGQELYDLPYNAVTLLTARSSTRSLSMVTMEAMDDINFDWEDEIGASIDAIVVNNLSQKQIRPYPLISADATTQALKIRYSYLPESINYDADNSTVVDIVVDTDLEIEEMWDEAIIQYVVGKAFIDYGDTSALSRAQVALGEFASIMKEASTKSKRSFSKRKLTTGYNNKIRGRESTVSNTCYSSLRLN